MEALFFIVMIVLLFIMLPQVIAVSLVMLALVGFVIAVVHITITDIIAHFKRERPH